MQEREPVVKDAQGRIVRSPAWIRDRIAMLTAKREDLVARIANVEAEIIARKAEVGESEDAAVLEVVEHVKANPSLWERVKAAMTGWAE